MLSRREKLLVQPWEDRRYQDHRSKVRCALPCVDARAPAPRPHVALKQKRRQREEERQRRVAGDNFSLLQRLAAVMKVNRLDNRWEKPLPNFHHKVGQFYDSEGLRRRLSERRERSPVPPLPPLDVPARCYACDHRRMTRDRGGLDNKEMQKISY